MRVSHFSPRTAMMPLGNTSATVTVIEPVRLLPCPALLSPLVARSPLYPALRLRSPSLNGLLVVIEEPNNEVRPISALLFLAICELAFLLAWVRSLRVMVMMSPTRNALRSLYRFCSKPAW
ncbi:hypothetical protein D3C81_2007140 [compost metagenome]